ncbi:MAG: L-aspartate oxidase [Gemmatimonadota bacterium]
MKRHETDILVIGSGIAGLGFVLNAVSDVRLAVVTKKERADSNTNYAQGGIAAVVGPEDSFVLHTRDTLRAGAGLCHTEAVREVVRDGPAQVQALVEWGVRFSRREEGSGALVLGREGGHSRRRIVHAADYTGREIERALLASAASDDSVEMYEDHLAVDLLVGTDPRTGGRRCAGALVLDDRTGELHEFRAAATLLASGGLGRVYRHTTNPAIATGDGVAMAYRAGARVANLEFVQFHPTALYPADDRAVLISEAVRGEGAVLRRRTGEPLLDDHPLGSLATRDVVARAIDAVLKEAGDDHVFLDLSRIPRETVEQRFPTIMEACAERGVDIPDDPIPVVPASHYACGGVCVDRRGRTSLAGLYASGEVAFTGVHGANRLASNSLLEALVYSRCAAEEIGRPTPFERPADVRPPPVRTDGARQTAESEARWRGIVDEARDLMWDDAGIVRTDDRLERASGRLRELAEAVEADAARYEPSPELIEVRNVVLAAGLIVRSARQRRESRGLHFNVDHPHRDNERFLRDTLLIPPGAGPHPA